MLQVAELRALHSLDVKRRFEAVMTIGRYRSSIGPARDGGSEMADVAHILLGE